MPEEWEEREGAALETETVIARERGIETGTESEIVNGITIEVAKGIGRGGGKETCGSESPGTPEERHYAGGAEGTGAEMAAQTRMHPSFTHQEAVPMTVGATLPLVVIAEKAGERCARRYLVVAVPVGLILGETEEGSPNLRE